MRVCSACEHEYDEDLSFCGKCGHPFGGPKDEDASAKLNTHLRSLASAAEKERRMEVRKDFRADRIYGGA